MDLIRKVNKYFTIKNVSYFTLILNLVSIVFGLIYLLVETYNIAWDIFGVIILITYFSNILLIYVNTINLNKTTKLGNRLNLLCYIYLVFTIFSMLFIAISNLLIEVSYATGIIENSGLYGWLFGGYFGLLTFATIIAYLDIRNLGNRELWDLGTKGSITQSNFTLVFKKILKIFLGFFSLFTLILGLYFSLLLFFGDPMGIGSLVDSDYSIDFTQSIDITIDKLPHALSLLNGGIGVLVAQFGVFFGIVFLCATVLLLKMMNRRKHRKRYYSIAMLGLVISGMHMLPLILTPYDITSA